MKRLILASIIPMLISASLIHAEGFTLTSKDISGQLSETQVFSGMGCTGLNQSPQLRWEGVPKNTNSFAITVYDPDAPTGSGWWHWIIFNIPAKVRHLDVDAGNIEKNIAPKDSVQSVTDFGQPGFGGACPPPGDKPHRYVFTVYALKVEKLELGPNTPPAMVGFYLNKNAIGKASLIAYYSR